MPFDPEDLPPLATPDDVAQAVVDANAYTDGRVNNLPPAYDDSALAGRVKRLEDAGGADEPGVWSFDANFGTFANLGQWMATRGAGTREEVLFGNKARTLDAPIPLWDGHSLVGRRTGPAREFGTGAVWQAGSGLASFFSQQANVHSYPSAKGVRDFSVTGVQFVGSVPVLPPHARADGVGDNAIYYTEFQRCGFVGTPLLAMGWADGLTLSGTFHVNSMTGTWLTVGGSILKVGVGGGTSYMDSNVASWKAAGKPFIETWSTQWEIGDVEISSRGTAYGLLVTKGAANGHCHAKFDAPDSAHTIGPAVRLVGVDGSTHIGGTGSWFHNNGGISVEGGKGDVLVEGTEFRGCSAVLKVDAAFTGKVLLGLNTYDNTAKVVQVANLAQIVCNDPRVTINDLAGNPLRKAA